MSTRSRKSEADVKLKAELDTAKNEILDLIKAYSNRGVTETELARTLSNIPKENRMVAINSLANEGKVQICKRGSDLAFLAADENTLDNRSTLNKHPDLSVEERCVLEAVMKAGNIGIWNRDIRNQTKVGLSQMSKILKNLETRKIIKAVKSVTASKKKLYMLYDLEPDKSITGGAWYTGAEFESEYVQLLHDFCYRFIKSRTDLKKSYLENKDSDSVSISEVKTKVEQSKISNVQLTVQDIETILETLVIDGLIEKIKVPKEPTKNIKMDTSETSTSGIKTEKNLTSDEEDIESWNYTYYYRALSQIANPTGVIRTPCGQCPYVFECKLGAVINPEKCLYLERWFAT